MLRYWIKYDIIMAVLCITKLPFPILEFDIIAKSIVFALADIIAKSIVFTLDFLISNKPKLAHLLKEQANQYLL